MSRPGVLHVVRDWVRPSEGFVADAIGASRATRPVVGYGERHQMPTPRVPAYRVARGTSDRTIRYALGALVVGRRASVLHAHFGYWAHHAEAVARRMRRPWGVSLWGHDLLVEGVPAAQLADIVVVPSRFLADAASRAGVCDERLRIVPAGIDLTRHVFRERTAPTDRLPLVTFAGRYVEKKGVLDAARALAGVPHIRARFVGHGPLEGSLRSLLTELRLEAELVDGSRPDAVRTALQSTDILLTASKVADNGDAETQGLVNLEALAAGAPLVTTRSGGIPETVGTAALLVDEGDVLAMRDAVSSLVSAPQRWSEIGKTGRAYVEERFDLRVRAAELEQLWIELAARGR